MFPVEVGATVCVSANRPMAIVVLEDDACSKVVVDVTADCGVIVMSAAVIMSAGETLTAPVSRTSPPTPSLSTSEFKVTLACAVSAEERATPPLASRRTPEVA